MIAIGQPSSLASPVMMERPNCDASSKNEFPSQTLSAILRIW